MSRPTPPRGQPLSQSAQSDPKPARPPLSFRQGDVLLIKVDTIPKDARVDPRLGRIVLAEGEATGHAHAIHEQEAHTFTHDGERYLLTRSKVQLIHEEHGPIEVPDGAWRVVIQREYEPAPLGGQTWRRVVD